MTLVALLNSIASNSYYGMSMGQKNNNLPHEQFP